MPVVNQLNKGQCSGSGYCFSNTFAVTKWNAAQFLLLHIGCMSVILGDIFTITWVDEMTCTSNKMYAFPYHCMQVPHIVHPASEMSNRTSHIPYNCIQRHEKKKPWPSSLSKQEKTELSPQTCSEPKDQQESSSGIGSGIIIAICWRHQHVL